MRVLVVNTGSSSVKLRLLSGTDLLGSTDLGAPSTLDPSAVSDAIDGLTAESGVDGVDGVGHRVVHGGPSFTAPVVVDDKVRETLQSLVDLAPLHLPASLAGLDAVRTALPDVPAVACFDTAFHATMPPAATTYAIPAEWREMGARRYGFHGLSHAYAARRVPEILGREPGDFRLVSCHLGAGASLCAVHNGRSVDTTMGFTPLEGLAMATRSGTVDPGLVLWLQQQRGISADEVSEGLERRSGLLGLAGTADMREVVERMDNGDVDAAVAFEVYVHRVRTSIAAMAAAMGGIDAVSFSGGVGEGSAAVRAGALAQLEFLGLAVNPGQNEAARGDANVSAPGSGGVAVVTAREDLEIAAQVSRILS
jgi:acetate kinase